MINFQALLPYPWGSLFSPQKRTNGVLLFHRALVLFLYWQISFYWSSFSKTVAKESPKLFLIPVFCFFCITAYSWFLGTLTERSRNFKKACASFAFSLALWAFSFSMNALWLQAATPLRLWWSSPIILGSFFTFFACFGACIHIIYFAKGRRADERSVIRRTG